MHQQGILSTEDIERISGKIILDYTASCKALNGSYQMSYNQEHKYLNHILLHINICDDEFYLNHFKEYIDQLLIHELGHYIYYFTDQDTKAFTHVCWGNSTTSCTKEDFISEYSRTNQEEDYAEHFMYWYLIHFNPNNRVAQTIPTSLYKKMWHFTTLFHWDNNTIND